jgi:hypothetical protein
MIRKSGRRFSEKITLHQKVNQSAASIDRFDFRNSGPPHLTQIATKPLRAGRAASANLQQDFTGCAIPLCIAV